MNSVISSLPAGFEALEPFVAEWAIGEAQGRYQRRIDSTPAERDALYTAGRDLIEPALAYLDQKPLADFDHKEQRLMLLLLSLCHVSQAVEVQKEQEAEHAQRRTGLTLHQASADRR